MVLWYTCRELLTSVFPFSCISLVFSDILFNVFGQGHHHNIPELCISFTSRRYLKIISPMASSFGLHGHFCTKKGMADSLAFTLHLLYLWIMYFVLWILLLGFYFHFFFKLLDTFGSHFSNFKSKIPRLCRVCFKLWVCHDLRIFWNSLWSKLVYRM